MRLSMVRVGPSSGIASSAAVKACRASSQRRLRWKRQGPRRSAFALPLPFGQSAAAAHDLVDRLRVALADQHHAIDLARLKPGAGRRHHRLRCQDVATIKLVAPSRREARFTVSPMTV